MTKDKLKQSLAILDPIRTVKLGDESGAFEAILQGLLSDLKTPNTLSVLFCEQIAESVICMRRHTEEKELVFLEATAKIIDEAKSNSFGGNRTYCAEDIKRVLLGDEALKNKINDGLKSAAFNSTAISFDSCRAKAFMSCAKEIKIADDLIQNQVLNIRHLQKSLNIIDINPRIIKRMDLDLKRAERDLNALEHDP
jgi:hypothetical protein